MNSTDKDKLKASAIIMTSWFLLSLVSFFKLYINWTDSLIPIVAIPLTLFTLITHSEPNIFSYIVSFILWVVVLFSPVFIKKNGYSIVVWSYSILSFILGGMILLGQHA